MGSKRSPAATLRRLVVYVGLLSACSAPTHAWRGTAYESPQRAPNISLETTHGTPFSLENFRGKVVLLYFGYTYCPDVCPATLAEMKRLFEALGDDSDRVTFAFISIDPERDTPDRVREYLDRFHPTFIGLVGSTEKVKRVGDQYDVYIEREESDDPSNYLISHTARVFIIDTGGRLRANYTFGTSAEAIEADVRYLLDEGG